MRCLKEKFNLLVRMIVELFSIKESPHEFEFSLAPEDIELGQENVRLIENVRTAGELKSGIVQTDVEGEILAKLEVECTRCLKPVEKDLEIPFNVSFITPENLTEEKETELNAEDLDVSIYEGDRIDLGELTREQIILNLPEQVFCSENCQGLCAKCGANRNLIDCNCIEKEIDPRWAALNDLRF